MGRSVAALLTMLATFAVLAALFVALDRTAGLHVGASSPLSAVDATRTTTPPSTSPSTTATPGPTGAPVNGPTGPTVTLPPTSAPTAARPTAAGTPTLTPYRTSTPTAPAAFSLTPPPTISTPIDTSGETATAAATGSATAATPTATTATTATAGPITATATVATATVTTTPATMEPTPSGGVTPPRYGVLLNYTNNTPFTATYMQGLDERIIALTNSQRAAHGLTQLTENGQLDIIAAARSQDLVKRNYFDHYDPTGPTQPDGHRAAAVQELLTRDGVLYTEVGENLVGNTGFPLDDNTPDQVVQAWMRHPEHRDNILHQGYASIGVGMAAENRPEGLRVVITQVFLR